MCICVYVDECILYTACVQYSKTTGVVGASGTRLQKAVHLYVGAGNGTMSSGTAASALNY